MGDYAWIGWVTTIVGVLLAHFLTKRRYKTEKNDKKVEQLEKTISEKVKEINILNNEIRKIKGEQEFEDSTNFIKNGLLEKIKDNGKTEYYCAKCWETETKKIHVIEKGIHYVCPNCETSAIFDVNVFEQVNADCEKDRQLMREIANYTGK